MNVRINAPSAQALRLLDALTVAGLLDERMQWEERNDPDGNDHVILHIECKTPRQAATIRRAFDSKMFQHA